MLDHILLNSEEKRLLHEIVGLVSRSGKRKLYGELSNDGLAIYDKPIIGEGETLVQGHIRAFESLRNHGFISFNVGSPTSSSMLRHQVDVTPLAIDYCKDLDTDQKISTNDQRPVTVLFLAANPLDTTRLRLGKETQAVDKVLRLAGYRDKFELRKHFAVQVSDLQELLLRYKPEIVHFSGHGNSKCKIVLEDNTGNSHVVSQQALSNLFSVLKDNVRCVVLNACYTAPQANAIAEHIDCVIGMSDSVSDFTAISFSTAFYQAIGFGRNLETAFKLGCVQVELENLGEQDIPKLLCINGDPKKMVFVNH